MKLTSTALKILPYLALAAACFLWQKSCNTVSQLSSDYEQLEAEKAGIDYIIDSLRIKNIQREKQAHRWMEKFYISQDSLWYVRQEKDSVLKIKSKQIAEAKSFTEPESIEYLKARYGSDSVEYREIAVDLTVKDSLSVQTVEQRKEIGFLERQVFTLESVIDSKDSTIIDLKKINKNLEAKNAITEQQLEDAIKQGKVYRNQRNAVIGGAALVVLILLL